MSAVWPSAVATTLQLLEAVNNTKVMLSVNAGVGDTTLTVDDASPLPASGYVTFDDDESNPETIYYGGISGNNLTSVTRGADSTAAATHIAGANLEQRWNAAYHNTLSTELIAVEQNLSDRFGVDTGSHTIALVAGTVTAPSLTFQGDTNTGLYHIGADDIAITTNGTKALEVNATQQVIIPKTSNQIIIGTTNTVTISSTAPSASRVYTIPDAGGAASFVMTAGTQTIAGAMTFSTAIIPVGGIKGSTGTGDAAAGNVDEYVSSTVVDGSGVSSSGSGQYFDITSISLSGGDWEINAMPSAIANGATVTEFIGAVSTTAGNFSTGLTFGDNQHDGPGPLSGAYEVTRPVCGWRLKLSGTTTVYLKAFMTYSGATPKGYGRISARRCQPGN